MKRSIIVRKQARRRCWNKAGCWRVKILVNSLSCESLDWRDAVCWQITQRSFVSDWQWACVEQRDAGHTRIKTELDKIGTKKQEVGKMGKTTKWQSSWDSKANENGDLFGDYLIKTLASNKSVTVRPGLLTCRSSYRPSRGSLPGKDFCEVKMDTPRHPPRKTAFQVDRKDLKFILCGIGRS